MSKPIGTTSSSQTAGRTQTPPNKHPKGKAQTGPSKSGGLKSDPTDQPADDEEATEGLVHEESDPVHEEDPLGNPGEPWE